MEQGRRVIRVPADRAIEPQVVCLGLGPAPCRRISASVQAVTASSNAVSASRATARSRHAIASLFLPIQARQRPRLNQADESRGSPPARSANASAVACKSSRSPRRSRSSQTRAAPGRAARGSDRSSGRRAADPWPIPGSPVPSCGRGRFGIDPQRPLPGCPGRERALASQMVPSLVDQGGSTLRFPGSMPTSVRLCEIPRACDG